MSLSGWPIRNILNIAGPFLFPSELLDGPVMAKFPLGKRERALVVMLVSLDAELEKLTWGKRWMDGWIFV